MKGAQWLIYADEDKKLVWDYVSKLMREHSKKLLISFSNDIFSILEDSKIPLKNTALITTKFNKKIPETTFLNEPFSLVELSILIQESLNKINADIVIFDAPEQILIHNSVFTAERFFSYLKNIFMNRNIESIFLSIDSEITSNIIPKVSNLYECKLLLNKQTKSSREILEKLRK
ncbi:MAG: hypothetical protein AABX96_01660 [Nanoarchaeota archaeon]